MTLSKLTVFVLAMTLGGCDKVCHESRPTWSAKKLTDSDGNEYAVQSRSGSICEYPWCWSNIL